MKDIGEASYVKGIEIFRDRSQEMLGLSQKTYIERILNNFYMDRCLAGIVLIQKEIKLVSCNVLRIIWSTRH